MLKVLAKKTNQVHPQEEARAGNTSIWDLKSPEVHAGTQDSRRPTPPPPRECRELWSPRDASSEVAQEPARHAGTSSPSGAPQDFGSWHPGWMPKDSAFPGAPAAGREDGGGGGRTPLKQQLWSLPPHRGRSGSLTRTGSRVTASCSSRCSSTLQSGSASSSCASFLGSTSSWSAARSQTVSFAGSWCGPCVQYWGSWPGRRIPDSGITVSGSSFPTT